jgi:hypothetical protein
VISCWLEFAGFAVAGRFFVVAHFVAEGRFAAGRDVSLLCCDLRVVGSKPSLMAGLHLDTLGMLARELLRLIRCVYGCSPWGNLSNWGNRRTG